MTVRVIQGSFLGGQPKLAAVQPRMTPPPIQARTVARPPGPPATAFAVRSPGPPAPAFPSRPPAPASASQQGTVQRHGAGGAFAVDAGPLGLVSSGGRPLPEAVRGKMEAALGADFSAVRVHVGPQAERIGAIAFTVGSDIYFAPGRYQPDTIQGQQLLGHELAHVVQQRAGRVRNPLGAQLAVVQDRALEAEADRMGQWAATMPPPVATRPAGPNRALTGSSLAQAKERAALSTLRAIQRDVGFEFQTPYHVERRRGWLNWLWLGTQFTKGEPLYERNSWRLTADGTEVEYITDPFPETPGGRNQLIACLHDLVAFCADLEARMQAKKLANNIAGGNVVSITDAELNAGGGGVAALAPAMGTSLTLSTAENQIPISAVPQATVGIRLDRIQTLYGALGTQNSDASEELAPGLRALFANAAADAANAPLANNAPALSRQMIGLLTQIIGLIRRAGQHVGIGRAYAKMGALLLNRTNFVTMYNMLSGHERGYYSGNGGQRFVDLVARAAGQNLGIPAQYPNRGINDQLMNYDVWRNGANAQGGRIRLPLTRSDWLRGITQGRDLLTAALSRDMQAHSDGTHPLHEFGLLGANTDTVNVGGRARGHRGVVFEFRDIRRMPKGQWEAFATDVFDYVRALNRWNGGGQVPVYNAHGRV